MKSLVMPCCRYALCCRTVVAIAMVLTVAGCATRRPAPVVERVPLGPPPSVAGAPSAGPETSLVPSPPPQYVIKRGDTLRNIALDHGIDYRDLAAWNNIDNINRITVGQVLRLTPPGEPAAPPTAPIATDTPGVTTLPLKTIPGPLEGKPAITGTPLPLAPSAPSLFSPPPAAGRTNTDQVKVEPKALKLPYSEQAVAQLNSAPAPIASPVPPLALATPPGPASSPAPPTPRPETKPERETTASAPMSQSAPRIPEIDDDGLQWVWPTAGKVVAGFSETANLKGIDIGGKAGQPVIAAAGGKVVYAGSGLRGYGKLVIIKHNKNFLSAYAHLSQILIKEGQQVAKGSKIGEMGNTDSDQVKLHFEIRRMGKPMDPAKYLPAA